MQLVCFIELYLPNFRCNDFSSYGRLNVLVLVSSHNLVPWLNKRHRFISFLVWEVSSLMDVSFGTVTWRWWQMEGIWLWSIVEIIFTDRNQSIRRKIFPVALCPLNVLQRLETDRIQASVVEIRQLTCSLMQCYSVTPMIATFGDRKN
jgi:hypothetical protein